jgi:hypothetical protein
MAIGPLRVAALLASILVGIGAGLAVADLRDDPAAPPESPGADGSPASAAPEDPLGIGRELVDLDCTRDSILVLGMGDTSAALVSATADFPDARYLRVAKSCDTYFWEPEDTPRRFVAYLGPFPTMDEACELRTSPPHLRHFATRLRSGNEHTIKCWCVLPSSAWPVLEPGVTPDERESIAIRQLQQALVDLGRLPDDGWPNGDYDQPTIDQVNYLNGSQDGVADAETWVVVGRRVCPVYNF